MEERPTLRSLHSDEPTFVTFMNRSEEEARAWWLNFSGAPVSYGDIKPGGSLRMNTFLTHPWIFRASDGCKLLIDFREVYFPRSAQFDENGHPLFHPVFITTPVYTLQECCSRLIRKMVKKKDIDNLEISEFLKEDIRRTPDLMREIQMLT